MQPTSVSKLTKQGKSAAAKASAMNLEDAAPVLRRASSQAMNAIGDMAGQARDAAADASESIIAYTKKNPAKALAIAVVAGALLFAFAKANAMRRD